MQQRATLIVTSFSALDQYGRDCLMPPDPARQGECTTRLYNVGKSSRSTCKTMVAVHDAAEATFTLQLSRLMQLLFANPTARCSTLPQGAHETPGKAMHRL